MTPRQKAIEAARERIAFLRSQSATFAVEQHPDRVEIHHERPSWRKGFVTRSHEIIPLPPRSEADFPTP